MRVGVSITYPNGSRLYRESDIDSGEEWQGDSLLNTTLVQDAYMRVRMWGWGPDQAADIDTTTAWMRGPTTLQRYYAGC